MGAFFGKLRGAFATQSLADIETSAIAPAIIESCTALIDNFREGQFWPMHADRRFSGQRDVSPERDRAQNTFEARVLHD